MSEATAIASPRPNRPALGPRAVWLAALGVQLAVLAWMGGLRAFPAVALAVALVGAAGRAQLRLSRAWQLRLALALAAVPVAAVLQARGDASPMGGAGLSYAHSLALAEYFVALQVAQFFVAQPGGGLAGYVPLLGIAGLLFAGNRLASPDTHTAYRLLALGFGALTVAYWETAGRALRSVRAQAPRGQGGRWVLLGAVTVLTCGLAWFGGFLAVRLEESMVRVFGWLQGGAKPYSFEKSAAGFSSHPMFDSIRQWKTSGSDEPALRVYSPGEPGYLRARTFATFAFGTRSAWTRAFDPVTEQPMVRWPAGLPPRKTGENLFDLRTDGSPWPSGGEPPQWRAYEVQALLPAGDALFAPLGARLLAGRLPQAQVDSAGVVQASEAPAGGAYRLFAPTAAQSETLTSATQAEYLRLPAGVDPRIRRLAEEVLDGCATPREKMAAVASYFRRNYEYQLSTFSSRLPPGTDTITYFLTEKPAGHCEYFATGAAILLRLGGVPCRYVTGFVASERNPLGRYWLARNRDAHAWVEAYDGETRTWRIVEATPSAGVPSENERPPAGRLAQWWDAAKALASSFFGTFRLAVLRAWLAENLGSAWRWAARTPVAAAALALCIAVACVRLAMRRRRRGRRSRVPANEIAAQALALLTRVDRLVAHRGLRRAPAETLHGFADRIAAAPSAGDLRPAAEWYRRYAALRYAGRLDAATVDGLRAACPRSLAPTPRSGG